ncbi:MAG: alkaline phosphatase D family protein [Acidimicrobiia bacterium]|nr:alkaline phosphatase D family protein [Acidimicrobiia bacterium]
MTLSRRGFLAAVASGVVLGACSDDGNGGRADREPIRRPTTTGPLPRIEGMPFTLGVASGDPRPDSVILWTRLAPEPTAGGGMPDADIPVVWEVATDDRFRSLAAAGVATASPAMAHSVHVDASGLDPARDYWYRFRAGDAESPVGRTRTTPAEDASPERLRFAFASCQNWQDGFWTPYRHLAEEDLDLVVFLGDYIYESAVNPTAARQHDGPELFDLAQYRNRYGLYKGDAGLQAVHAAAPWLVTWDDHEVDNNYADDLHEDGDPPEAFLKRRADAYRAWYEHTPVRLEPPSGPDLEMYRRVGFGDLATFHMLDERQYRSDQPCNSPIDAGPACAELDERERTMLGERQERWLLDGLARPAATWDVLANSVILAQVPIPLGEQEFFNFDQWDGYPPARRRLLDRLAERDGGNAVVITGDIHASGATDLLADFDDERSKVVGSELIGTSVSSEFDEALIEVFATAAEAAPWVTYYEARQRGYVRCEMTAEEMRADFRHVETTATRRSPIATVSSWAVEAGRPGLQEA